MLTHGPWTAVPGLRHGFLDRRECAAGPWETVVAAAGASLPITLPRQVHGTRVISAVLGMTPPEADGLATATGGELVGILTADCVPVLLLDRERRVAAAVHAGWRGAAAGVLEAALAHLETTFGTTPADLEAAIGPAVGGCCYEVGAEVFDAFRVRTDSTTAPAWRSSGDRWYVDLRAAARLLLLAAGVRSVTLLGPCTACGYGYASYRRDGKGAGRQLSFIGWG